MVSFMIMAIGVSVDRWVRYRARKRLGIITEVRTLLLNLGSADSTVRAGGSLGTPLTGVQNSPPDKCLSIIAITFELLC